MCAFRVTTAREGGRTFGRNRNEHDDRTSNSRSHGDSGFGNYSSQHSYEGGSSKRGSSRRSNFNNRNHSRGRGRGSVNPRSYLDADEDVDMGGSQRPRNTGRYVPYGGSKSSRTGSRLAMDDKSNRGRSNQRYSRQGSNRSWTGNSRRTLSSHDGWFKVLIPYGKKASKDFVLQSLTSTSDIPFVPVNFTYENNNNAVFYVEDKHAATALQECSRKITMPNGYKMVVVVNPSSPPTSRINNEVKEKIKVCMSARYDPATKALNLQSFHTDQEFRKDGLMVSLYRREVMGCILSTIKGNIPELVTLDMSNNKLNSIESLQSLHSSAPNLLHLNLGHNSINHEAELNHIQKVALVELILDGNPVCDRFHDEAAYISAIRKRFPKVVKLDGTDLPPPITFDVESDVAARLPPTKGSFFLSEPAKDIVCRFLEQYYALYDGGNRQDLMSAYHDQAFFSLTIAFHKAMNLRAYFGDVFHHSRNLLRCSSSVQRQKLLKTGRLRIVSLLNELPPTQHDPAAFVVDVTHVSEHLMTFVVHGLFKEVEGKKTEQVFAFSRTFVTIPQGQGIVIVNEEWSISAATEEQKRSAFKTPAPTPSSSPVQSSPATAVSPAAATPEQQQAMVMQFAQQSSMNLEWATKCLAENGWNFESAAKVFTDLNGKGMIPAEAFK